MYKKERNQIMLFTILYSHKPLDDLWAVLLEESFWDSPACEERNKSDYCYYGWAKNPNRTESNRINRTKTDSNRTKVYFKPFS